MLPKRFWGQLKIKTQKSDVAGSTQTCSSTSKQQQRGPESLQWGQISLSPACGLSQVFWSSVLCPFPLCQAPSNQLVILTLTCLQNQTAQTTMMECAWNDFGMLGRIIIIFTRVEKCHSFTSTQGCHNSWAWWNTLWKQSTWLNPKYSMMTLGFWCDAILIVMKELQKFP